MDLGLRGTVAIVVGASRGMGRASAIALGAEGARVALVARDAAALEAAAADVAGAGGEAATWALDVTDPAAIDPLVGAVRDRFGRIDVAVYAVGVCEPTESILAAGDEVWARHSESVLMGAVRLCRAVVPVMQTGGGGSIITICAMSVRRAIPTLAHYSSLKAALAHFTKSLAREFAHDGIRANAVLPGMIASEHVAERVERTRTERGMSEPEFVADANERYGEVTFANRLGRPDEVGSVVAFLASDRASYVNGAWINVDGGSHG
jgi:NAD(P)-dependent dehydrogenase (short-subunit alcohol dehydrogenase family)